MTIKSKICEFLNEPNIDFDNLEIEYQSPFVFISHKGECGKYLLEDFNNKLDEDWIENQAVETDAGI